MNEELLRSLHNSLGGDKAGSYQSFVEEFNKSDELRQTLWNKLGGEQAGTFESFLSEVGFSTPKPPEEKKPTSAAEYFGSMFEDPKTSTQSSFKQQDQETLGMPTFMKMFPGKKEEVNKARKEQVDSKLKEQSSIFYENNKLLNDPNTSELDRKAAVLKSLNASRVLSSEASSALKEIHGIDLADVDKLAYKAETLERKLAEINRLPLSKEERELRSSEVSSQLSETNKQLDEFTKYVGSIPEYQYLQESINSRKQLMEIADANFPELKKTREETEQEQKESDEIAKSSELSDEFKTVGRWIGGKILGTAHNLQKSGLGAQRILARAFLSGDAEKKALINTLVKEESLEGVAQSLSPSSIQGRFNEEFVKTKDGTKVVFENGEPAFGRDKDGYKIELTEDQIKEANEKSGEGLEKDYNYGMLLNNFSQVAFDMIPTILVTRGLGTGSKLASAVTVGSTTAAQAFGNYYFDALKNGASEDKAIGLALSKSILDGALENIGGLEARLSKIGMEESTLRLIKEDVIDGLRKGSIAQKDVLKYYASRVKETVTGGLKQGVGETIEEFSQSLEQGLMDMFVMNDRKTLEEIPKDALETFLISMGLGTGTSFLQEASAFKKNTSNDLMYNSILMAINNPDKAAQVAKDMELSDTSFIDIIRDDVEALGIKDDQKKLEALRLLSQRYALERQSGKEKSGSVASKVRSKKIKEIEAELNALGENKIYEPSEEEAQDMDNRPEVETSELLDVLNKTVKKTEDKKEEQKPAVQSSIEFPSVESLEEDLEFNDFDPKKEFSFEKEESPVDTPQVQAQEDVSETDYQAFVETGNVKDEVLTSIATKVESGNTELTDRETAIFTSNTDKVNKILQDQRQEEVKDTTVEQTDSRVFKVGNKNFNIVPTSNSEMGGEISVDDKTYKAWKKRDEQEKRDADLIKRSNWSKDVKEKQLKANAISSAADKRRILGTFTKSESKNITKKEAGIQIGDKATVGGITYGVLGHAFGRIKVRTNEGNEFTVTKDSEVAKALKDQKKKTSTEAKGEIVQNKEEFLRSKGSDKMQQKTDGGKETNLQQRIEKVKSALKALVPDLKVKIHNTPEEYKQDYEKRHPNMDEEGKSMLKRSIASFDNSTNTIRLNLQRLQSSSLFHEGTHPLIDILEALNPGYTDVLFDELLEIEKELGIEGEYTKKFASQYPEAQRKNEAVVQFIAKVADGTIDLDDKNVFFKVKKFLSNIWDRILRALGKEVKDNINTKEDLKNLAKTISEAFNTGIGLRFKDGSLVLGNKIVSDGKKLFSQNSEDVVRIAQEYKNRKGIKLGRGSKITSIDVDFSKRLADAFDDMKHDPDNKDVMEAYEALGEEVLSQFRILKENGYTIELHEGKDEPYANSQEMLKDLIDNKHLYIFSTKEGFGENDIPYGNPLLLDSGEKDVNGKQLLVNDLFRFVNDVFGHGERGNSFGPIGEENAWDVHARMFSPLARRAMTTETRGQNSWVNFGKHLRNEDGSIKNVDPKDKPFADQKTGLLPVWASSLSQNKGERFQLEDDSKSKAIDNIKNYFTRKNIPKTPDKIDKFYSKFESDLESAGITKDDISRSFNPPPGVDDTAGTTTDTETPEATPRGVDPQAVDEKFLEGVAKDVQNVQDSDFEKLVNKYHANNERLAEALNPDLEGLTEQQRSEAIDEKKYLVTTHERMLSSMDKFFSLLKGRFQENYLEKSYELFNSIATKDSLNAAIFGIRLKELIETRLKDPSLSTEEAISLRLLRRKLTRDLQVKGKEIARVLSLYRRIKNNANTIRTNVIANTPGAKKRAEEIESELEKAEDIDENEGFKSPKPSKDSDVKPKTKKVPAMDALAKAKAKIKGVSDSKTIGAKFRELTNKRPC